MEMSSRGIRYRYSVRAALFFLISAILLRNLHAYGWSNGGFSSDPLNPDYGTHDWIAHHALDWLPDNEKAFIISNLKAYLYGTELPDNRQALGGVGDTAKHHVYYYFNGSLQDDASAKRAQEEFESAVSLYYAGNISEAVKRLGAMTHYISDLAVFGHVMGAPTIWGKETHHDDYESYVDRRTNTYDDEFNIFLSFDGTLETISAYNATLRLAFDTTFDVDGDLICMWMDWNYNWSNPVFRNRCGESLNLAVNLVADVLHTFYLQVSPPTATIVFSANLDSIFQPIVLTVDGVNYTCNDLPKAFTWNTGSNHSFEWANTVSVKTGERYVWISTSGFSSNRSSLITAPSEGGSVIATYRIQYYLTIQPDPLDGGSVSPLSGWYDKGTQVTISTSPSPAFIFVRWDGLGNGSYSGVNQTVTISVNEPITQTARFSLKTLEKEPSVPYIEITAALSILIVLILLLLRRRRPAR